jgi:hypothetical protein
MTELQNELLERLAFECVLQRIPAYEAVQRHKKIETTKVSSPMQMLRTDRPDNIEDEIFESGFGELCKAVAQEASSIDTRALIDFDYFRENIQANIPEISDLIIDHGEDAGLLEIAKPIRPGAQWFEIDKKSFFISESRPGYSNSTLQLSDHLCGISSVTKIKIRPNCFHVRSANQCSVRRELANWYGPPLTENWLQTLMHATAAAHAPNNMQRPADGFYTEFNWDPRKGNELHLSIEELPHYGEQLPDSDLFIVRFIHAVYCKSQRAVKHIDGALHMYSKTAYRHRLRSKLSDFTKDYQKAKIFRIDESLTLKACQPLIEAYFKWNFMVVEYFKSL